MQILANLGVVVVDFTRIHAEQPASRNRRCGATIDWLIGSHALESQATLITSDTGDEFDDVETVPYDQCVQALRIAIESLESTPLA